MNIGLAILAVFVLVVMTIGNVVETRAHKSPKAPLEDLRIAYAPDLTQVLRDRGEFQQKMKLKTYMEQERRNKGEIERYQRQLQEVKIKRWLEGNPVTDENPLTKKEIPHDPYISHYTVEYPYL